MDNWQFQKTDDMERIEIYSSRKRVTLHLIISLFFVAVGLYFILFGSTLSLGKSPVMAHGIGILVILFFGLGVFVSLKNLFGNPLMLVIDRKGLLLDPKHHPEDYVRWGDIDHFSEIQIEGEYFVIIHVHDPDRYIEQETNAIKKELMKFNLQNYDSPFNLTASSMDIKHQGLLELLRKGLHRYQPNKVG